MGQNGVQSAILGPQLLPLPSRTSSDVSTNQVAGEIQMLQPTINVNADKDTVDRIDRNLQPSQVNLTFEGDIVKSKDSTLVNQRRVVGTDAIPSPNLTTIKALETKEIKEVARASNQMQSVTKGSTETPRGGAPRIDASLFSTIIALVSTVLMFSLARNKA